MAVLQHVYQPGENLTSETVQCAALALQRVDNIHSGDSLALGVLGVRHGITDHVLQEHLQYATRLLVDQARDTLNSTTASQTADGRLGDALDVITKNLAMTLRSAFAQSFSSLAAAGHNV